MIRDMEMLLTLVCILYQNRMSDTEASESIRDRDVEGQRGRI